MVNRWKEYFDGVYFVNGIRNPAQSPDPDVILNEVSVNEDHERGKSFGC